MKAKQGLIIVAVILGLLLLFSLFWGWKKQQSKKCFDSRQN